MSTFVRRLKAVCILTECIVITPFLFLAGILSLCLPEPQRIAVHVMLFQYYDGLKTVAEQLGRER